MTSPAQSGAVSLLLLVTVSCAPPPPNRPPPATPPTVKLDRAHVQEVAAWRKERLDRLTAEAGYLALAGLFWLEAGTHRLGSAPGAQVRFPARARPDLGAVAVSDEGVTLTLAQGVEAKTGGAPVTSALVLRHDGDPSGEPQRISTDGFTFMLIKRGERLAIRLWDRESPTRAGFKGLKHYPVDGRWRVTGRYTPYARPRPIKIPTVVKTTTDAFLTGEVHLTLGGKACTLYPLAWPGDKELFFHFTDGTTGAETYGGGRFLVSKHRVDQEGDVLLDFNLSHTPPCAFTEYATCPIPLEQNKVPVAVTAGEREP